MFYDINLMNSSTFGVVWRAANHQEKDTSEVLLPKVCSYMSKCMKNYEDNRRRNLSLRTSSLLLNGAVRVFKEQLDSLYEDCIQLNEDFILRRRSKRSTNDLTSLDTSNAEPSRNTSKRQSSLQRQTITKRRRTSQESNSLVLNGDETVNNTLEFNRYSDSGDNLRLPKKSTKAVQTTRSFIFNAKLREEYRRKKQYFDKNSPVGLIIVYDTESRLPNKIICSNINKNVRKL